MKTMRRIATLLLAICLVVPCFSIVSHAANRIMFEDPSTAVGEKLALKGVIQTDSAMEDRMVVMTYDTTMLKFVSGDNVTETEAGKLTYDEKGVANGTRVEFIMNFDVLKEGTTQLKAVSHTVYSTTDARLNCEMGYSTIQIAAGTVAPTVEEEEPAENVGAIVEVDGEEYTFTDQFDTSEIPEGFVESTLEYAGTDYKVVMQEETGLYLGYLVNADGEGEFFLFVSETATFAPFVQKEISDTTVITFLSNVDDIVLAEPYELSKAEINGSTFPAWQNTENTDLWILYAMNNQGEASLYQFDSVEETYQRFEVPVVEEEEELTFMEKLDEMLGEHINTVIYVIGIGFILLLVFVIVLSVKLYNRNAELDELYDEYGIDLFDDEELDKKTSEKGSRIINLEEEDDFDYESHYGLKNEEEETFTDIAEETEDDIVIAELDEVENNEAKDDKAEDENVGKEEVVEEIQEIQDPEEAIRAVAAEIEKDGKYWDDEDDLDFELDFIDLDD